MKTVIIMGSTSDEPHAKKITDKLNEYNIEWEQHAASAHKQPLKVLEILQANKNKQDIKQLEKSNIYTPSQSPRLSEGVSNDEEKDIYTMNIKGKEINVLDFIAQSKEQQTEDK